VKISGEVPALRRGLAGLWSSRDWQLVIRSSDYSSLLRREIILEWSLLQWHKTVTVSGNESKGQVICVSGVSGAYLRHEFGIFLLVYRLQPVFSGPPEGGTPTEFHGTRNNCPTGELGLE